MAPYFKTYTICMLVLLGAFEKTFAQEDYGDEGPGYGEEDDYGGGYGGMDDYGGGYGGGGYGGDYGGYGGGGGASDGPETSLPGVVDLDDNTFGKVVDGRHHAFVMFYGSYDEGSKAMHAELATVGTELGSHKSVILAKVNADVNEKLVADFNVGDEFPVLLYLAKDSLAVEKYTGEQTADAVMDFITERAGEVGTVESLKALVDEFMTSSAQASNRAKMEFEVSKLKGDEAGFGAYYLKVAKKVIESGPEYVKKEFERLQRMIVSGSLRPEKEVEFKLRSAVLKVFSREKLENFKVESEDEENEHEEL